MTVDTHVPAAVSSLTGVIASLGAASRTACAVADGDIYCWGRARDGQRGDGTTPDTMSTPVLLPTFDGGASLVAVGPRHICGVKASETGRMYCWGGNWYGELGDSRRLHHTAEAVVGF